MCMSYDYEVVDDAGARTRVDITFDDGPTVRHSISEDAVDENGMDAAVADVVQNLTSENDALPDVAEEPETDDGSTEERTAEVSTEESETDADEETDEEDSKDEDEDAAEEPDEDEDEDAESDDEE